MAGRVEAIGESERNKMRGECRNWRTHLPKGAYAVVTGASQGLGRAFAEELARGGVNLHLVALPDSGLDRVGQALQALYDVSVETHACDMTAEGAVESLCEAILSRRHDLAMLINNAGVGYNSTFVDSTLRQNETCILLNNLATVKMTRLLLPALLEADRARILNVASMAAMFPMPYMPVYAPSKSFVLSFSQSLRQEQRGTSVGVSALCPNGIRTSADARDKIASHGKFGDLFCMDADQVAQDGLRGVVRDRAVVVPGALNRAIAAVSKIAPRWLVYSVVGAFWGKTAKKPVRPLAVPAPSPAQ